MLFVKDSNLKEKMIVEVIYVNLKVEKKNE